MPDASTYTIGEQRHYRLADLRAPATVDEDARTIDVVWSKGSPVQRMDWMSGESYIEELDLDGANLKELNRGAPFLDSHNAYSLRAVIGSVLPGSARIEDGEAVATIRMSSRPDAAGVWDDITAGHIRAVSVGYLVEKYEVRESKKGSPEVWRAVDWTPFEISAVPIGADPEAGFRSAQPRPCTIDRSALTPVEETMKTRTIAAADATGDPDVKADEDGGNEDEGEGTSEPQPSPEPAPQPDAKDVAERAAKAERTRSAAIRDMGRRLKVDEKVTDRLVREGVPLDKARIAIIDHLADRSDETAPTQASVVFPRGGLDERTTRRAALESALLHRHAPSQFELTEAARQYRGMTLMEMARASLEDAGERARGFNRTELATRALHTTSDFASVLANVANKSMMAGYEYAAGTYRRWATMTTVSDFKAKTMVDLAAVGKLDKVNEHGEFKHGTFAEGKETIRAFTYGKILGITRQTLINDDLGAFTQVPQMLGDMVGMTESEIMVGLITANAAMSDGVALFHNTHKNLASVTGAPAVATISAGRTAVSQQTDLTGRITAINPNVLLVPAALETVAQQVVYGALVATKVADTVTPAIRSLEVITEPLLDASSATAWYLIATRPPGRGFMYAFLEGEAAPQVITESGFDVAGIRLRIMHDFGAAVVDYRTMYKNAG